jgi:hypothetical protein
MSTNASRRLRFAIAFGFLALCTLCVGCVFWKQELQYRLPTPVPQAYAPVPVGTAIHLTGSLSGQKARFLHFYNPDCPCSRFNVQHLRMLIGNYNDSISIAIVVASDEDLSRARKAFGDQVEFVTDIQGAIASACGVYSTPQAAIIDREGKLYYRGNYNISRYCTSRASNFAELSLLALMKNQMAPQFGLLATESYGCSLARDGDEMPSL